MILGLWKESICQGGMLLITAYLSSSLSLSLPTFSGLFNDFNGVYVVLSA